MIKYTQPDQIHTSNYLSSYTAGPYAVEFEGIKYIAHYLYVCTHCPIMYSYGIKMTGHHELHQ